MENDLECHESIILNCQKTEYADIVDIMFGQLRVFPRHVKV